MQEMREYIRERQAFLMAAHDSENIHSTHLSYSVQGTKDETTVIDFEDSVASPFRNPTSRCCDLNSSYDEQVLATEF